MLKTLTKKIVIVLITIIMLSNFIMPNYVHAGQSAGEKLVSSFFYLLAYVGDKGIGTMQNLMTEYGSKIKLKKDKQTSYAIKYSPGMIFANEILALDINFINPNKSVTTTDGEEERIELFGPVLISTTNYSFEKLNEYYGFIREKAEWDVTSINGENGEYGASTKYIWTDENTGKIYEYIHTSTGTRGRIHSPRIKFKNVI